MGAVGNANIVAFTVAVTEGVAYIVTHKNGTEAVQLPFHHVL